MRTLKVKLSTNGLPCLEFTDLTEREREIIFSVMRNHDSYSEAYQVTTQAGAFLQGEYKEWMLIEFWQEKYQNFVNYLSRKLNQTH